VAQNSPNPFNPATSISFTLAKAGKVTVDIFNAAGQKVDTVVNTTMNAGNHSATWNASRFSAGVYFYTVTSGDFSRTMKMTLLK
ncbi:MAG: T9SS type A sorting domain-containing protein, partial [Candidatus Latescibacter sp.]|nr:T9SS type A sorting domain-containing protein [Candidatus Latescibacter sp.]